MAKRKKESKALMPRGSFFELDRWERDMERMMEEFFGRGRRSWWPYRWPRGNGQEITLPAIDLYEDADDIVVKAELPGLSKDDIEVKLSDHLLTIKGEKKREQESKGERYYRSERSYGSFVRNLQLPKEVHSDKAKASFKNGVLEIRMPKTEEAKSKEIHVKVE